MNWTGHVVPASRSDLAALLKRPEIGPTGIYLLLGDDPERPGPGQVYVGEGDDVGKRLYQHGRDESKDFWDRAVVLTSEDMNLTKAHARYLESRFVELATEAGRAKLTNATAPPPIHLAEADVSDMEYFVHQDRIILPVLGINVLRSTSTESDSHRLRSSPIHQCSCSPRPVMGYTVARKKLMATSWSVQAHAPAGTGSVKVPKAMHRFGLGSRPMRPWCPPTAIERW